MDEFIEELVAMQSDDFLSSDIGFFYCPYIPLKSCSLARIVQEGSIDKDKVDIDISTMMNL